MDHYLGRFLDAGLRTEEGLFAVSTWGPDLMERFLDQLLRCDGLTYASYGEDGSAPPL
jgi:hypothetical protein